MGGAQKAALEAVGAKVEPPTRPPNRRPSSWQRKQQVLRGEYEQRQAERKAKRRMFFEQQNSEHERRRRLDRPVRALARTACAGQIHCIDTWTHVMHGRLGGWCAG